MKTNYRYAFGAILLARLCFGQVPTTTVIGSIVSPQGDPISGTCSIQGLSSYSAGSFLIAGAAVSVPFTNGAISVALVPTNNNPNSPATYKVQYYKVTCVIPTQSINGHTVTKYTWGPRYWLVPSSSTSLNVTEVEVDSLPPAPGLLVMPLQLSTLGSNHDDCIKNVHGVARWVPGCTGGGGGSSALSWAGLTSSTWASITDVQWAALTN